MSERIAYGVGGYVEFPLIGDGVQDFVTDYVPAAGDAKLFTDTQISTNLTSFILGFDSLSEIPAQGATIEENGAGTAEGVVEATIIISGTVGGGDAAGFFFMRSVTGQAWSNDDQIDINGGTANIATADSTTYDLAATAGLIADLGEGQFAAGYSPTEATFAQGTLRIRDSATKAIEDQTVVLRTEGNALAYYKVDAFDAVRGGMSALPNAAAEAAGGLYTRGTGAGQLSQTVNGSLGSVTSLAATALDLILVGSTFVAALIAGVWDRVLTGGTHNLNNSAGRRLRQLQEAGNIYAGRVHVDTVDGVAGTAAYENGTSDNPTDLWASAITIAASIGGGIKDFHVVNGSAIVLGESNANHSIFGDHYTLDLNGQACGGLYCEGATVSGAGTSAGEEMHFEGCDIGTATVEQGHFDKCGFTATLTMNTTDDYEYHSCYDKTATAAIFTKTAGQMITAEWVNWSGSITISGIESGDAYILAGTELGDIVLNGADGTVVVRGIYTSITDNRTTTGGRVLTITGAVKAADVAAILGDTADMQPKLGSPAVDISADIAAVKVDTAATLVDTADMQPKLGTPATDVSADIAAVKVDTAATLVDTADMQPKLGTPVTDVSADIAAVKVDTAATLVDTAVIGVAGAGLTDLGGMSTGMKAEVNAEADTALDTAIGASPTADSVNQRVKALDEDWEDGGRLDALLDRLIAEIDTAVVEPGQDAPPSTAKRGEKIDRLYKALINESRQTATLHELLNAAGTVVDQKRAVSDDATTFIAEKVVSGP